jgi:hypothetical protein
MILNIRHSRLRTVCSTVLVYRMIMNTISFGGNVIRAYLIHDLGADPDLGRRDKHSAGLQLSDSGGGL